MANRTQIHKKASSHFTPTPATGMFQPRPFAEPVQPETATPEVQTKVELGNIESDRLSRMSVETQNPVETGNFGSGQAPPIQAKLTIGAPGDKYEQEADTIARKVVQQISAPTPPDANPNGDDGSVQRQFSAPSISRLVVQRREAIEGGEASSDLESTIGQAKSSGVPLAAPIRRQMEGAFGTDFSGVRIHANNTADTLNRQLSSRAFTTGNNIFFKRGEYDPGSSGGKELLAHELTHVVQQGGSVALKRVQPSRANISDIVQARPATRMLHRQLGGRVQRDGVDPTPKTIGNTKIKTADISLEKIGHGLIYNKKSLEDGEKKFLRENNFHEQWYPDGNVTNAGSGMNYGLLLPTKEGKQAGKVPVLAFRGTSDIPTFWQDLDWNSPGHEAFKLFVKKEKKRVDKVLKENGFDKIDVTGHSLGGALAQHFTGTYPSMVRRLVTFQSAAANAKQYQANLDALGNDAPEIVHHVAKGDIVDLAGGEHLRGTFYEHSLEQKEGLAGVLEDSSTLAKIANAHTSMLLNTQDIVENNGKGKHKGGIEAGIKVKKGSRPYGKSKAVEAARMALMNKALGIPSALVVGLGGVGEVIVRSPYYGTKYGAKKAGSAIASGATSAYEATKSGAKKAGSAISSGATSAWNKIKKVKFW